MSDKSKKSANVSESSGNQKLGRQRPAHGKGNFIIKKKALYSA